MEFLIDFVETRVCFVRVSATDAAEARRMVEARDDDAERGDVIKQTRIVLAVEED